MSAALPNWLWLEALVDQGPNRALYPYPLLNNILSTQQAREAVLNETTGFEAEFGLDLVSPLYQLLWRLNTIEDIFTSHLTIPPPNYRSPFEWAKCFVGAAIIVLPRNQNARHDLKAAEGMAHTLARVLSSSKFVPSDTTGWRIRVFPTTITFAYGEALVDPEGTALSTGVTTQQIGYGHELVISGSAGTRRRAAERWSRTTTYVLETLASLPKRPPYQQYAEVNGVRTVPGILEVDAGLKNSPPQDP